MPSGERIVLLDALRGFGVLGILLMNVLAFGLLSPAYSYPGFDVDPSGGANRSIWIFVDLFGEGAMRGLFSVLFGAGVVLFTTGPGAKSAAIHYRRMFFLLLFGLFDAYVLLWFGDILICYALCGAMLYPLRNWRPRGLVILAFTIGLLSSLSYLGLNLALSASQEAAALMATTPDPSTLDPWIPEVAAAWDEFAASFTMGSKELAEEQLLRSSSYATAFSWNLNQTNGMLFFITPLFLLWDALFMMLLGMALFKWGVLTGDLSPRGAARLTFVGLGTGLALNSWEIHRALAADLSLLSAFSQTSFTYHIGRTAMTLGYVGLLASILHRRWAPALLKRLTAVGRMALSNYLLHSVIALLIFTGAGLGLVGEFSRAQLYILVIAMWLLQLYLSPWWLGRHRFGPLEYLWRRLTYGNRPTA